MSLNSAVNHATIDPQARCEDELTCFAFGPFLVHVPERRVIRAGKTVKLGGRAFDLLIALAQRAGQIVSKVDLIKYAWSDVVVEESSLRVNIVALRRALEDGRDGARYIINVAGRGYCLVAPVVRRLAAAEAPSPGDSTGALEGEGFVVLDPTVDMLKPRRIDASGSVGAMFVVGAAAIIIVLAPAGEAPYIDASPILRGEAL